MNISLKQPSLFAKVFTQANLGSAFLTCASRMVGASYRVYDAYDPKLRATAVSPEPEVVIKREAISLGLAWCFGLFTAMANTALSTRLGFKGKNSILVQFTTVAIANALAEGVSRLLAYRGLQPNASASTIPSFSMAPPAIMTPANPFPGATVSFSPPWK